MDPDHLNSPPVSVSPMLHRCPLIFAFIPFAVGILLAGNGALRTGQPLAPVWHWTAMTVEAAALVAAGRCLFSAHFTRKRFLLVSALLVTVFTAGGLVEGRRGYGSIVPDNLDPSLLRLILGNIPLSEPSWFQGRIRRVREEGVQGVHCELILLLREKEGNTLPVDGRIMLQLPPRKDGSPPKKYLPGQVVRFFGLLRIPTNFYNPGGFDYRRFLTARGFRFTCRLKDQRLLEAVDEKQPWLTLLGPPNTLKQGMERIITREFINARGQITPAGAILMACLSGNRSRITSEDEQALRRSGLSHVLAISGLHLGIMGFLLYSVMARLLIPSRARHILLIIFFSAYVEVSGAAPSVRRAALVAVIFLLGELLGFRSNPLNSLAAAGLILLQYSPLSIYDPGFILTFTATFSIVLLGPLLWRVFPVDWGKITILRWFMGMLSATSAVFLGLLPVQGWIFNRIYPVSVLVNLAVIPLLTIALASGVVFLLANLLLAVDGLIPWVVGILPAEISRFTTEQSLDGILWLARNTCHLSVTIGDPSPALVIGYYLALSAAMVLIQQGKYSASRMKGCLGALSAAAIFITIALLGCNQLQPNLMRLTFIDVGQGDAALIELPGGWNMALDGGRSRPRGMDLGEMVVTPVIWQRGLRRLQAVAMTHADIDHAGGLPAVIRNFRPSRVLLAHSPESRWIYSSILQAAATVSAPVVQFNRGRLLRQGAVEMLVLNPPNSKPIGDNPYARKNPTGTMNQNNLSLVLLIRHGHVRILLTGDLESEGEEILLSSPLARLAADCHLLKVGHHGAGDASSRRFLELVKPRAAVISVGRFNRFGHPDPAVLKRLGEMGCQQILRTDRHGAITVISDGRRLYFRTSREASPTNN